MNISDEERTRCDQCLRKLHQTKFLCIQSIQYLIEQQREIDECTTDLKATKSYAQEINKQISELNPISWLELCCVKQKKPSVKLRLYDPDQLLILPFPNDRSKENEYPSGLNELEKDFQLEKLFDSLNNSTAQFNTKEEFQQLLYHEYTTLFELAKKLTKCIQILHDTIEFLGIDIKLTLEHMQSAQPRMRQLLKMKVPFAFSQAQKDLMM